MAEHESTAICNDLCVGKYRGLEFWMTSMVQIKDQTNSFQLNEHARLPTDKTTAMSVALYLDNERGSNRSMSKKYIRKGI